MYKVTVGVCCYRQKEWLYRCLRSLASQNFAKQDYEIIVVNDDPADDISEVCEILNEDDPVNFRLINNEQNLGLPASLNNILKKARGQYFVRVDADDYVSRHFLYVLSLFLNLNRDYQAVACDYRKVNEVGTSVGTHSFADEPIACGIMFTYESLCNLRFYDEKYAMREGHDLLKRFTERYKLFHLPMPLYRYRMHDNNRTLDTEEVEKFDQLLETNQQTAKSITKD